MYLEKFATNGLKETSNLFLNTMYQRHQQSLDILNKAIFLNKRDQKHVIKGIISLLK